MMLSYRIILLILVYNDINVSSYVLYQLCSQTNLPLPTHSEEGGRVASVSGLFTGGFCPDEIHCLRRLGTKPMLSVLPAGAASDY